MTGPLLDSVAVFVAKERERDAFVSAAAKLHAFAEHVCVLADVAQPESIAQLAGHARRVLQVMMRAHIMFAVTGRRRPGQ